MQSDEIKVGQTVKFIGNYAPLKTGSIGVIVGHWPDIDVNYPWIFYDKENAKEHYVHESEVVLISK